MNLSYPAVSMGKTISLDKIAAQKMLEGKAHRPHALTT